MRVGLVQLSSSDNPADNLPVTVGFVEQAASSGARLVVTPEVTNCVSLSRKTQLDVLSEESEDPTLLGLRAAARKNKVWILIGSLALKSPDGDRRFVNRSFMIDPNGQIRARHDKIHMFDVALSETETYRESDGYQPGERSVVTEVEDTKFGLTICYDLRFPQLYRDLAQAGAKGLTVPSAFSVEAGVAHWETLLRARAIETGSYVLAPAQCGEHAAHTGRKRRTYGHTLAVGPWGEVLVDGGDMPGVFMVDLDLSAVDDVRSRLPSLSHDVKYERPE